jgi:hypothetical protein
MITHPASSAQPSATSSSLGAKLVVSTFKLNIRGRSLAVSRADSDDAQMHAINQSFSYLCKLFGCSRMMGRFKFNLREILVQCRNRYPS